MMRRLKRQSVNLLDLKPTQQVPWETAANGTVVVLVPKFRNEVMVKWVVPHLHSPNMRVQLDRLGSFVWKQCDGKTTVAAMAESMKNEFGDSLQAVYDRIRTFLLTLEKSDLITLESSINEVQHQ
jgi:hypothetical protein